MEFGLNSLPPWLIAARFCLGCAGRSALGRAPLEPNPERPVLRIGTAIRLPRSRILKKPDQQDFRSLEGGLERGPGVARALLERFTRACTR